MTSFFLLGLALAVSPGPDFFLMSKHTLTLGTRYGYMTLLGNRTGFLLHLALSILGLSALIRESFILFLLVSLGGACYLLQLGCRSLYTLFFRKRYYSFDGQRETLSFKTAYTRGLWSNLLNPKVSLFFISIFPSFMTPLQLAEDPLLLPAVFLIGNSIWYVTILPILGLAALRQVVQRIQHWVEFSFAFVFIGYGIKMLITNSLSIFHLFF
ncbi:lysine exporter protein LysE/YggA [Fictibacillus macauensis ZFHKF-1]|uniref:Lysine exporter protein LysE/YggA n=1 Tax=Fictibacillus macauensis ZFHKF-1 TaxID=1196324 RepID=I8J5N3_9BACL|nr:LysE family transporter [Fictibacillus macauensis]EIT87111.1 lysine exporter protein LysE/YggA [Fictibacillus macauensis ZFHKF-1]